MIEASDDFFELLPESYFKGMQERIEEDKKSEVPLKKWNLIQKELWSHLVADGYVAKNDYNAFYTFGKVFNDYYEKTGHFIQYARLVSMIGGY
jgi:hypothetical protein